MPTETARKRQPPADGPAQTDAATLAELARLRQELAALAQARTNTDAQLGEEVLAIIEQAQALYHRVLPQRDAETRALLEELLRQMDLLSGTLARSLRGDVA